MKTATKVIVIILYCTILISVIIFNENINQFIINNFIYKKELKELTLNEYSKREDYNYVQITHDFETKSKKDILNNIYTIVDSGMDEFSFYCDKDYVKCVDDIKEISGESNTLTLINNFVHPYNSFNKLFISTNSMGKITISVDKLYNEVDIAYINKTMNEISSEVLTEGMSYNDAIKAVHDYLINNTKYDEEKSNEIKNNIYSANINNSHKATGLYSNHIALCSGYTDAMAIFLNYLNIKNYKISTDDHIWNAVELDNNWYHLDLTWDDPVRSDGVNMLIYDFFLADDEQFLKIQTTQHSYNKEIYPEMTSNS